MLICAIINPNVLKFPSIRKFTGPRLFVEPNINQAVETYPLRSVSLHAVVDAHEVS